MVHEIVDALGGRSIEVPDDARSTYHAAAAIASNHLVALLGQVQRVAAQAGIPLEAYLDLVRGTVDNVAALGPAAALTGPVARGDWETVARHLAALPADERTAYQAMANEAARLGGRERPGVGFGPRPGRRSRQQWSTRMPLTVLDRADSFRKALDAERQAGHSVGLVPTMGYLHAGHTSLMQRAAAECDVVAATSFVNPLQFAPGEDLAAYPRDPEGDQAKAAAAGVEILFAPPTDEMFPEPPLTAVTVASLSDTLEGASRPSHFAGVATVVTKLFALAGPCRAYFGEKDFQQLAVIRRLVQDLSLPVEVVGCPTVRDSDGLALSSRNAYLSAEERAVAPALYRALSAGRRLIEEHHETDAGAVRAAMHDVITAEPLVALDYAEVVNVADLSSLSTISGEVRLLIAARLGRARLIDNLGAAT
jgi:pantoate--beta-alanine ligase